VVVEGRKLDDLCNPQVQSTYLSSPSLVVVVVEGRKLDDLWQSASAIYLSLSPPSQVVVVVEG
jgi:hypothetical protein